MKIHCSLNGTGLFDPRKFRWLRDVIIILTALSLQFDIVAEDVPDGLKGLFRALGDRIDSTLETSKKVSPPQDLEPVDTVGPPSPEMIKCVEDPEVLDSSNKMNWILDDRVSTLSSFLGNYTTIRPSKREFVERLQAKWFKKGHNFLRLPGPEQWLTIDRLLTEITEKEEEAIDQLGIRGAVDRILILNERHGELLGLTKGTVLPENKKALKEERKQVIKSFNRLMGDIIVFANVAWPGDENAKHRETILFPYLDRIRQKNEAAGRKKNKKKQAQKASETKSENMYPEE